MEKVPQMRKNRKSNQSRKQHAYPEETRELAIKMYYGGVSARGVGKILGMNKSNVTNWIKKETPKKEP